MPSGAGSGPVQWGCPATGAGRRGDVQEIVVSARDVNLVSLRREFHRFPELGGHEERTKARIGEFLRELGIEVHSGAGVIGVLRAGRGNRAIGLRADMDALPVQETSRHEYPSECPGVMHACGHDGHVTMLLGAARALAADPVFDGVVVFIFQPDEEQGSGARTMISEGVLKRFPIEEVYAIHNLPGEPLGRVSTRPGLICSSESLFEIAIHCQGGHASMPQDCGDAITAGAEIIQALQTIVSRKLAPSSGAVVSVTDFRTDGRRNVLPGSATLKGEVRARGGRDRNLIEAHLRRIGGGVAAAHGVSVSIDFSTEFVETINAEEPVAAVVRAAGRAGLNAVADRSPMSFSEDFAQFAAAVPGCLFLLGNGEEGRHGQPLHASDYDFNDDLLPLGTALWTELVRDRLPARQQEGRQ